MTVWFDKGRGGHRYDFWLFRQRHTSPRTFETDQEARDAEYELRRKLRRQRAGLEPLERPLSPTFSETAGAYYTFIADRKLVDDLETVDRVQRCILRFFGVRPSHPSAKEKPGGAARRRREIERTAPYHNLRLQDVIDHPSWLLDFEAWMTTHGLSGSTKNRYRSACSRLYWFAMLPERREQFGITSNPFRGILRDKERGRDVTLSPSDIAAIIQHAPDHLRLAIVIAALAPKLRLANILSLRWDRSFDRELRVISVRDHKTARRTGRPMKAPIIEQLRLILEAAKKKQRARVPWVIHFRGKPITRVETGLADACAAAGVTYGRAHDGATFHTIRHSAATILAEIGVPDGLRKDVMGHLSIQTTQKYTHLQPMHEVQPLEQLSARLPLAAALAAPRTAIGGTSGGTQASKRKRAQAKVDAQKSAARRAAHERKRR